MTRCNPFLTEGNYTIQTTNNFFKEKSIVLRLENFHIKTEKQENDIKKRKLTQPISS